MVIAGAPRDENSSRGSLEAKNIVGGVKFGFVIVVFAQWGPIIIIAEITSVRGKMVNAQVLK